MLSVTTILWGKINLDDEKTLPEKGKEVILYANRDTHFIAKFDGTDWILPDGNRILAINGNVWSEFPPIPNRLLTQKKIKLIK